MEIVLKYYRDLVIFVSGCCCCLAKMKFAFQFVEDYKMKIPNHTIRPHTKNRDTYRPTDGQTNLRIHKLTKRPTNQPKTTKELNMILTATKMQISVINFMTMIC